MRRIGQLISDSTALCPHCGSHSPNELRYTDDVVFRSLTLEVAGLLKQTCAACSHTWVTDTQRTHNSAVTKNAFERERDRIRDRDGLLTGERIAELRKDLDLTQRQAAAIFGGGSNAFNKYESGEVLQSFAMDRLLRLTYVVGKPAVTFLQHVEEPQTSRSLSLMHPIEISFVTSVDTFQSLTVQKVRSTFEYESQARSPALQVTADDWLNTQLKNHIDVTEFTPNENYTN